MTTVKSPLAGLSADKLKLLARKVNTLRGAVPAQAIERRPASTYPASFAQERLWLIQELFADLPSYNAPLVMRLPLPARVDIWEAVIRHVAARHEIMRTSLRRVGEELQQIVEAQPQVTVGFLDLTALPPSEREAAARAHVRGDIGRPFDLAQAPLWRIGVIAISEEESIVHATTHHSICDGASRAIIQREAQLIARALLEGRPVPELGDLRVQYGDFARWQRERIEADGGASLSYWRSRLADLAMLELPTDRPRPAMPSLRHGAIGFAIPAPTVAALQELARSERASLFMLTLAAFVVLLQRYAGQDDIAVGTPVSTRDHASLEPLLGYFVNTVVLRCDVSGDPSFRELLARVRTTALDALSHKHMPFEQVIRDLGFARDLSRNPLFMVSFQVEDEMASGRLAEQRLGEFMNPDDFGMTVANLDLDVHLFGAGVDARTNDGGMSGIATYDAELFDVESIRRMMQAYLHLLGQMASAPDQPLSSLALCDAVVADPVATPSAPAIFPVAAVCHWARELPDAPAVLADGQVISYAALVERAQHLAAGLEIQGIGEESLVGLSCRPGVDRIVGLLGVMLAGAAFVPLAWDDPPALLASMSSTVQAVLVGEAEHGVWTMVGGKVWRIDTLEAAGAGQPDVQRSPAEDGLAYGIWTSGSTGEPKLALNTQGGLARVVGWMNTHMPLERGERVLHRTGLTFDVSLLELLRPLAAGATIVCATESQANDPRALVELIREHGISTAHFVPSMLGEFVAAPGYQECASLRRLISIGEMLPPSVVAAARRKAGVEVVNMYGPAEAAVVVTHHACEEAADAPLVSIGRPFDAGDMLILDCAGQPVPVGVPGDLYLAGPQIGRGYAGNPALTAQRWLPHPTGAAGARIYRTGDRARLRSDGTYELLGRLDHMVKLRGQRIELEGIEAIASSHPHVGAAAAKVIREPLSGDTLVLWVAPALPDQLPDAQEVRKHLAARLPRGMLPSEICVLDELPRNRSGKIQRGALVARGRRVRRRRAPRDAIELRVMNIWSELLQREDLSVDDDFFAVGGHSLLAVRLLARITDVLGATITLAAFYPRPTVEGIALALRTTTPGTPEGLVCLRRGEEGGAALFLFPAAGGRSITYLELSRSLPPGLAVWSFDQGMKQRQRVSSARCERWRLRVRGTWAAGRPEPAWLSRSHAGSGPKARRWPRCRCSMPSDPIDLRYWTPIPMQRWRASWPRSGATSPSITARIPRSKKRCSAS